MSTVQGTETIQIHPPNSGHPSLADAPGGFDRTWFMGRWGVAWSTLPMWKDKKDVVIEYEPVAKESKINTTFSSVVYYHKTSAAEGSKPSTVRGTETLSTGMNGANFDWKGSSYLFFVHSHWEVLGYGRDESSGLEWAVTFFSKTLFTPAGLDIYVRSTAALSPDTTTRQALVDRIVEVVKQNEDERVRKHAEGGFNVPGVV